MDRIWFFFRNVTAFQTLIGAVVSFFILWFLLNGTASQAGHANESYFSGLMSILSILSGFVAAFYFFAASRGNTFLEAIQKTKSFTELLWLTRHGLAVAIMATLSCFGASLHQLSVSIDPRNASYLAIISVVFSAYAVGTIWRCARIFNQLVTR